MVPDGSQYGILGASVPCGTAIGTIKHHHRPIWEECHIRHHPSHRHILHDPIRILGQRFNPSALVLSFPVRGEFRGASTDEDFWFVVGFGAEGEEDRAAREGVVAWWAGEFGEVFEDGPGLCGEDDSSGICKDEQVSVWEKMRHLFLLNRKM